MRFAVRSSAVGEDGSLSFAGQHQTVLNSDLDGLVAAYRQVIASKYSARALRTDRQRSDRCRYADGGTLSSHA
jgi:phosphoenolpyruvate synthase/pyruvate phosphate dikinase